MSSGDGICAEPAFNAFGGPDMPCKFTARVPYPSNEEATLIKKALSVDPELRPESVLRELHVEGNDLIMNFAAVDARTLRAAVGTFCDLVRLATETMEAFPLLEERAP